MSGSGSGALVSFDVALSGVLAFTGVGSAALPPIDASATGGEAFLGLGFGAVSPFYSTGVGSLGLGEVWLTLSPRLAPLVQSAVTTLPPGTTAVSGSLQPTGPVATSTKLQPTTAGATSELGAETEDLAAKVRYPSGG